MSESFTTVRVEPKKDGFKYPCGTGLANKYTPNHKQYKVIKCEWEWLRGTTYQIEKIDSGEYKVMTEEELESMYVPCSNENNFVLADCVHRISQVFCRRSEGHTNCDGCNHYDNEEKIPETVNHPNHYQSGKFEVIDIIEEFNLGFNLGNTIKYLLRCGKKDPSKELEDLEKARWYLDREISKRH
jgi:hypothetical protein